MPVLGEGGLRAFPYGCKTHAEALAMKAYYFEVMGYDYGHDRADPDPRFRGTTKRFHQSDDKVRVLTAPARTSKSFSAAAEIVAGVMPTEPRTSSMTYIVGVDYKTNKEFEYIWQHLVDQRERWNGIYRVARAVNNPNQGNMVITLDVGRDKQGGACTAIILGKSSTNERSLQGEQLTYAVLSEAAEHEARIWTKYLAPRTWRAIFPTTPKQQARWIRDMIDAGEADPEMGIGHFHMSRYANPLYDHANFEREKKMAASRQESGNYEDDPLFMEQFMGAWVYYTGKVLPVYDRHLVNPDSTWFEGARFFVSCDYGYEDGCVMLLWVQRSDGVLVLWDEVYERHIVTREFVERGEAMLQRHGLAVTDLSYACGDPREPQVEQYLRQLGFPVVKINKNQQSDRALGMRRLIDLLSDDPDRGGPSLLVSRTCAKTLAEWDTLHYREGHQNEYSTGAFGKCADHAFDASRYFVTTMPEPPREKKEVDWLVEHKRRVRERRYAAYPQASGLGVGRWAATGVSPYA